MNIVTSLHPGDPQTMEGHAHIHVLGEAGGTKDLGGRYLNQNIWEWGPETCILKNLPK